MTLEQIAALGGKLTSFLALFADWTKRLRRGRGELSKTVAGGPCL
jgi:hypothetical protein